MDAGVQLHENLERTTGCETLLLNKQSGALLIKQTEALLLNN